MRVRAYTTAKSAGSIERMFPISSVCACSRREVRKARESDLLLRAGRERIAIIPHNAHEPFHVTFTDGAQVLKSHLHADILLP